MADTPDAEPKTLCPDCHAEILPNEAVAYGPGAVVRHYKCAKRGKSIGRPVVDAMTVLRQLYDVGCPLYQSREPLPPDEAVGHILCLYCDANIERNAQHTETCLWRVVERLVKEE